MKKALLVFLILFLSQNSLQAAERQLVDQVAAVVNDEVITQSEIDGLLRPLYEQYRKEFSEPVLLEKLEEARSKLLQQLIEDRLVFQQAKEQSIEIDEGEIEKQVAEFRKRFKDEKELEDTLAKEGFSMNDMRERLRRQALVRKIQDMEVRSRVVISPKEVEDYFQKHPEEFSQTEQVRLRSITIKKDNLAREQGMADEFSRKTTEGIREKILAGESFGVLAKEYSQDTSAKNEGLGEWVGRGEMIEAIEQVIFKLQVGEVSSVVETPMGYHLFRLEEKRESKKLTLEEAREAVFEILFQKKSAERFQTWLEELKRNAYISIR